MNIQGWTQKGTHEVKMNELEYTRHLEWYVEYRKASFSVGKQAQKINV